MVSLALLRYSLKMSSIVSRAPLVMIARILNPMPPRSILTYVGSYWFPYV